MPTFQHQSHNSHALLTRPVVLTVVLVSCRALEDLDAVLLDVWVMFALQQYALLTYAQGLDVLQLDVVRILVLVTVALQMGVLWLSV